MATIAVTGAQGRLGSALVRFYQDRGEDIVGLARGDLDLADKPQVVNILKDISPSLVIHTAAQTNVDGCERDPEGAHRDNVYATEHVIDAVSQLDARLIYFSTDYVFDGEKSAPYIESDSPNPVNVYGQTKLAAERIVAGRLSDYVIIRVAWLFGAGRDFVNFVQEALYRGDRLKFTNDHRGSPGYIPDLLPAIGRIAGSTETGIFHLTNGGDCSRLQMGQEILKILGKTAEIIPSTGSQIGFAAKRPPNTVLSCKKCAGKFSIRLRTWQEALSDYLTHTGQD